MVAFNPAHRASSWQKGVGMDPNQCKKPSQSCCFWWPSTPLHRGFDEQPLHKQQSHCTLDTDVPGTRQICH